MDNRIVSIIDTGAIPGAEADQSAAIQRALDEVWKQGGGTVEIPAGKYNIGSIRIRSNTTLLLRSGAELYGSRNPEDYNILQNETLEPLPEDWLTDKDWEPFAKGVTRCYDFMRKPGGRWGNAMIRAISAENVAIIGEEGSVIDGRDCYDERGEERYRGPHGISMHHCKNVSFSGYTIRNTGNWAHCIFNTDGISMKGVTVLAGHDGIHMTSSSNIDISDSSFYTGDDCIAGFANVNVRVEHCTCNTACSGMRFGGTNVRINECTFFGPAQYFFRGSLSLEEKINGAQATAPHRKNMLCMFKYYADYSVDIPLQPGNIIIKNCRVENVDRFMNYNFSGNEKWQSNRPLKSICFENIKADGIGMPLTAYGSADEPLLLELRGVDISFREDAEGAPFLRTANFEKILLEDVAIRGIKNAPLIKTWTKGGEITLRNVTSGVPDNEKIVFTDEPFMSKAF